MNYNHETYNLEELLSGYVLGNLDEKELAWLNEQLASNPQLQQKIDELEATLTLMPYGLPDDVPNSDLRSKICGDIEKYNQEERSQRLRFPHLAWVLTGLTTFTTLFLGVSNYGLREQLAVNDYTIQKQQELIGLLRQPNNSLVALQGLDELSQASGSLFIAPQKKKAILVLQNLAPLSGKQVYRLWAVSQKEITGCANFTPDDQGVVHLELSNNDLTNADSILITIEPEADTEQPQGNPVMNGYFTL